jgi:TatD DNase family protein
VKFALCTIRKRADDRPSQPSDVAAVVEKLGRSRGLPAADMAGVIRENLRALLT